MGPVDLQTRELIAHGAQGSVLLVWDRSQRRFLALKLVEVSGGEAAVGRLLDELGRYPSGDPDPPGALVDFGNALHAPAGVASAFPTLAGGRRIWILMFYIHGPNARELVEGDPAFGPTEVAALLAQVAARLRGLEPGRAHLDLKPENLLVDRAGRVHVVDFHLGTTEGTPGYSAPEQRGEGGTPGPASDLYALGKIGASLLARRFPKDSDDAELFPQLPEAPADLRPEQRRNIKELGQLQRGLCHPEPAKRGTIEDVAKRLIEIAAALGGPDLQAPLAASVARAKLPVRLDRLGAALAKEPPSTASRPLAPGGTLPRDETLKRVLARAAGSVAVLLVALIAFYAWQLRRPDTPRNHPSPAADPPLPAALAVDPVFADDAPLRTGLAVPVEEGDKIRRNRALFGLQLLFRGAEAIAVLNLNDGVASRIEKPLPMRIYRWDVQPGTFRYAIYRHGYPPERAPETIEAGQRDIRPVKAAPESAPIP